MEDWEELKLDEIGTLQRGRSRHRPRYAFHLYGGQYPFIQTGEIREAEKYISNYENTYSVAGLAQSKLWPKGTLCITIAANIAELAIMDFDGCFPDSVLGFIADEEKTTVDFIYYSLCHFQKKLKHIGTGSVQDNINLGTFQKVLFPIPPLPEQKAIAEVLSSLDDKIDLLHRQNETLEQMAQTLFRQWFVEEADEDWEEFKMKEICEIRNGFAFKSKDYRDSGHIIVRTKDFINGYIETKDSIFLNADLIKNYEKYQLSRNELLLVMVGASLGKSVVVTKDVLPALQNQNMWAFRANDNRLQFYLNYMVKILVKENIHISSGSARSFFQKGVFYKMRVKIPPIKLVEDINESFELFFRKIENNREQIQTLEKLRDTLLPKLMSGEVRVNS